MHSSRAIHFYTRHRVVLRDLACVVVGTIAALYYAYRVDIFTTANDSAEASIELDEFLLIGALLGFTLFLLSCKQYLAQRRELRLRLDGERRIRDLAYQDGLTGLANRLQFEDAVRAAIAAPPRAGAVHAIYLMDLNSFKLVNDVHGHGIGDDVLIEVARRLRTVVRDGDLVARFGGDEFAVLSTHLMGPEAATGLGLRTIEAVDSPIAAGHALHRVGVAVGVALFPDDARTLEELLRKADIALYRAKAERRSAVRFFEQSMDVRIRSRAAFEGQLREAIDAGDIQTMFQPTFDLATEYVIGFDATPHWTDPQLGDVGCERFLAFADEVGLIHAIAEKTLRDACRAAANWPLHVGVSVDVYPSQLKDGLFASRVLRILSEAGVAPARLELEITEAALVADIEAAHAVFDPLRAAGVRVAIDNFGTGYSSLYHLRTFKVDKIKIDRSFVHDDITEVESAGIVSALAGLAHGFGLTVAADGVSRKDQSGALLARGCEQGQGSLLCAPLFADQTLSWVGKRERASSAVTLIDRLAIA